MTNNRLLRELADVVQAFEEESFQFSGTRVSMSIQFMTEKDEPVEPIFAWDGREFVPVPKGAQLR